MTTATIANGASLSSAVKLPEGYSLVGVQYPSAWTTTSGGCTFQASIDGTTYTDLYNSANTEINIAGAASRYVLVTGMEGVRMFKFRSGTTGSAVTQGADRVINLAIAKTI